MQRAARLLNSSITVLLGVCVSFDARAGGPFDCGNESTFTCAQGTLTATNGVTVSLGESGGGTALAAQSNSGVGISGVVDATTMTDGASTSCDTAAGVCGLSTVSGVPAGAFSATSGFGVLGTSTGYDGISGQINNASHAGVSAVNSAGGYGLWASAADAGIGVYGQSYTGYGVFGATSGTASTAVKGNASGYETYGVDGYANGTSAVGVHGSCGGTGCAAIYASGDLDYTGALTHVSDERLKRDVTPLKGSVEKLLELRGVSYYWKDPTQHGNNGGVRRGFIAQDYEKVFPEWVKTNSDGMKMIDTEGLDSLEVESIRQLKSENDDLRKRVEALEAGRRPVVSTSAAWGWLMGLALGAAVVVGSRRKSKDK